MIKMENIGKKLKNARRGQSKSLEEIHDETRVSIEHLRFLEENDFTFLPETYVKSFLKTYAESLGLDANEILNAYKENQKEQVKTNDEPIQEECEIESVAFRPKEQFIEWALGVGTFILLVSLIFVYIQYKSQIFAEPVDDLNQNLTEEYLNLANITVQKPDTRNVQNAVQPLELEIKAIEKIWLRLTIDGKKISEYTLAPNQNLIWIAENRFDLLVSQAKGKGLSTDGIVQSADDVVHLTFTRDSLNRTNGGNAKK